MSGQDGTTPPSILIVEDEVELATLYADWLEDGYRVEVATTGQDALDRLNSEYDVVLLDRRIPDISGDEILNQIRDRNLDTYVVMVTAVQPDTSVLELDFDEYLIKPVERDDIETVVELMLERRRYDDQLRELFRLASRLATLEAKMDLEQLQQSDTYHSLETEFHRQWDDMEAEYTFDDIYQEGTLEKLQTLLERLRHHRQWQ